MPLLGQVAPHQDSLFFKSLSALDEWYDTHPKASIFEGGAEADCLRLLVGRLPTSRTKPTVDTARNRSLPASAHYARLLADLARDRGFDGYLLNFECPLQGGFEQTRALTVWISLLRSELNAKVGSHAEVIWYDSVVITGQLAWQDRLNAYNLPFFLPSTGFFTNYTWRNYYPENTAAYFTSLDPTILTPSSDLEPKLLNDVYMGVDVWGRGSHGGGGLNSYRAIQHIQPESLGLSVALFGQAWSWETEQDKPGFTWEHWWAYERSLWVGTPGVEIKVPEVPRREGEPDCVHGPPVPLSEFFTRKPPPNPSILPFHTTFSPGVGRAWFVSGVKKFMNASGWTDIDKQSTIGDLVWPKATLRWEDIECAEEPPKASSETCFDDAWNGGSSLRLAISSPPSDADDASFRQVFVPIQSLSITPGSTYHLVAVYKIESDGGLELDAGLNVEVASGDDKLVVQVTPDDSSPIELHEGWIKLSAQISLPNPLDRTQDNLASDVTVKIGLTISIATEDTTQSSRFSILIGQMNVYPFALDSTIRPRLLWADYQPSTKGNDTAGTLTWEVAASLPPSQAITIPQAEDLVPVWNFEPSQPWVPEFLYFNIYITTDPGASPETGTWIGTSGMETQKFAFRIEKANLPLLGPAIGKKQATFHVQGVNARGEVLPWEDCVSVTVDLEAPALV
ncbi:hypothetical protein ONZ45_g4430 [Pleurotus djamor]|nr:hypothetical protein ONZ45_g4430 [Pleurotus djamor]